MNRLTAPGELEAAIGIAREAHQDLVAEISEQLELWGKDGGFLLEDAKGNIVFASDENVRNLASQRMLEILSGIAHPAAIPTVLGGLVLKAENEGDLEKALALSLFAMADSSADGDLKRTNDLILADVQRAFEKLLAEADARVRKEIGDRIRDLNAQLAAINALIGEAEGKVIAALQAEQAGADDGPRTYTADIDPRVLVPERPISQYESVLSISLDDTGRVAIALGMHVLTDYDGRKGCYLVDGAVSDVEVGAAGDFAAQMSVTAGGYDHNAGAGDPCPLMTMDTLSLPISGVIRDGGELIQAELGWFTGPLALELLPARD